MLVMVDYYGIRLVVIGYAIETCYCSHRSDFHRFDQSMRQFTLFMNGTLSSTIYLDLDAVMAAELSSHKSKFIYHFKIVYYQKKLFSNRGSMEKL